MLLPGVKASQISCFPSIFGCILGENCVKYRILTADALQCTLLSRPRRCRAKRLGPDNYPKCNNHWFWRSFYGNISFFLEDLNAMGLIDWNWVKVEDCLKVSYRCEVNIPMLVWVFFVHFSIAINSSLSFLLVIKSWLSVISNFLCVTSN